MPSDSPDGNSKSNSPPLLYTSTTFVYIQQSEEIISQLKNREYRNIHARPHGQTRYSHTCKASGCGLCIYIRGVKDAFNGNLTSTTGLSL